MVHLFSSVNENSAKCTLCSGTFSYKGGATANLTRHLTRKHPTALISTVSHSSATQATISTNVETDAGGSNATTTIPHSEENTGEIFPKRKYQSTLSNFSRRLLSLQNSRKS